MSNKFFLLLLTVMLTGMLGCGGGGSDDGDTSSIPTGIRATAGDGQVVISWDLVSGATSYNIYWSTSPVVTTSDNKISGVTRPYPHTGLTNGTTYYYVVTAVNSAGESDISDEVSATPQASTATPGKWDEAIWDVDVWGD